jgi:hypothetical protein
MGGEGGALRRNWAAGAHPRGSAGSRASEVDHGADALALVHQVEGLLMSSSGMVWVMKVSSGISPLLRLFT